MFSQSASSYNEKEEKRSHLVDIWAALMAVFCYYKPVQHNTRMITLKFRIPRAIPPASRLKLYRRVGRETSKGLIITAGPLLMNPNTKFKFGIIPKAPG